MKNERTKCEIYTRVVGFLSPVSQWNAGKKAEYQDRETYNYELVPEKSPNSKD